MESSEKRLLAELAETKERAERLELALRGAGLGTWDWYVSSGKALFNDRWAEMLGYEPSEIEPHFESWRKLVHPVDLPRVRSGLDRHLQGEAESYSEELRMLHKSGRWLWIHTAGRISEWDQDGKPLRVSGTHRDITRRRQAEEERRRVEQKLREAQRLESLGVLAGGIAHDFNNLLVAILGNAELAIQEAEGQVKSSLEEITLASRRAADLARQMLAYSGRGRFAIDTVSLSEVVGEMSHLLSAVIAKGIVVEHRLSPGLPAVEVDVTQVRQVVMNLITNASDAMADTGGTLTVTTGSLQWKGQESLQVGELEPGEYVYLEVSDDGCGMDETTQQRLFEAFYSTKGTGRGLGLAATLGIVRGHRGGVSVTSEPSVGTTIRVLFPACSEGFSQGEEPGKVRAWTAAGTILVVDDERPVRKLARTSLEKFGWSVLTASDGFEALELFGLHQERISAVLLDQSMPRLSGCETFKRLRGLDPKVKVVMTSGYDERDVAREIDGEPFAFLGKPFGPHELATTIKELIHSPFSESAHNPISSEPL